MGVIRRLNGILSASLNDLIEKYEDPELLLKQALREMEQAIGKALADAAKVVAHEKVLTRQIASTESVAAAWRQRAVDAVQRGDDQAARAALRHKQDHETNNAALARQLAETAATSHALRRQVGDLRTRVEDARRKLDLLTARNRAAHARQRMLKEFSVASAGEEAFQTFERMCRKVERAEAEAEAMSELAGEFGTRSPESLLTEEDATTSIEAELLELKAQSHATA